MVEVDFGRFVAGLEQKTVLLREHALVAKTLSEKEV